MDISSLPASTKTRSDECVYYRGRPDWITDEVLTGLQNEAAQCRPDAVLIRRQFHAPAGPVGRALACSPDMLNLIERCAAAAIPTGPANYLYYERPGSGIDPHIDTDQFDLNVLMVLSHTWLDRKRSALHLFPDGPDNALRFWLEPGQFVVFRATAIIHARSDVAPGEQVTNLGIGYEACAPLKDVRYWRP
jgi:hypothetical protein